MEEVKVSARAWTGMGVRGATTRFGDIFTSSIPGGAE